MSRSKRIAVDDVYVGLEEWDSEELIAELRERALRDDKVALAFLFEPPVSDIDAGLSTAALLSRGGLKGIDLRDVAASPFIGAKAVDASVRAAEARRKEQTQ